MTPGALVTANQAEPLATVQNLDKIYVDVTQSAADLLKLRAPWPRARWARRPRPRCSSVLEDGSTYPIAGRWRSPTSPVDAGTGSVGLRAIFPNPDGALLPGLYVRAPLDAGRGDPPASWCLRRAVSRDPKGTATVCVVDAARQGAAAAITVARTIGDKWLVTAGLKAGRAGHRRRPAEGRAPARAVKPSPIGAWRSVR